MCDSLDVSLHDRELRDEVVLTTNLIIASSEADGRLTQEQIDEMLGL